MNQVREQIEPRALALHKRAIVIDTGIGALPFSNQKEGGVTATHVSAYDRVSDTVEGSIAKMTRYLNNVYAHPDELAIVMTADDIRACKREGKVGFFFGFSGMHHIGYNLDWIEIFSRIGVKSMSFTYNESNQFGCGAGDRNDTGLTYLGCRAIHEMNRVGVVVDISHMGDRTAQEVLKASYSPVILSHSNCRALADHLRNASDSLMRAVAEQEGVMCISTYAPLLDDGAGPFPTIETMINHIDHAVSVMGIDHVGIGTDSPTMDDTRWLMYTVQHRDAVPSRFFKEPYYGKSRYHHAEGFRTMVDLPKITEALVKRGYSDDDILKILGANRLRIYEQVWGKYHYVKA